MSFNSAPLPRPLIGEALLTARRHPVSEREFVAWCIASKLGASGDAERAVGLHERARGVLALRALADTVQRWRGMVRRYPEIARDDLLATQAVEDAAVRTIAWVALNPQVSCVSAGPAAEGTMRRALLAELYDIYYRRERLDRRGEWPTDGEDAAPRDYADPDALDGEQLSDMLAEVAELAEMRAAFDIDRYRGALAPRNAETLALIEAGLDSSACAARLGVSAGAVASFVYEIRREFEALATIEGRVEAPSAKTADLVQLVLTVRAGVRPTGTNKNRLGRARALARWLDVQDAIGRGAAALTG